MFCIKKQSFFKLSINFLIIFNYFFPIALAEEVSEQVVSYYKNNYSHLSRPVLINFSSNDEEQRTVIFGPTCHEVDNFSGQFMKWASLLSEKKQDDNPLCECRDSVCYTELTDYFPNFFRKKMYREDLSCHGANCYNTTLIARGFLDFNQSRYSSLEELMYYLNTFCKKIPLEQRDTNDIITYSHPTYGIIHTGLYIGDNFLMTKEGVLKYHRYELEDRNHSFLNEKERLDVFRCQVPSTKETHPLLRDLENEYTTLVDSEPDTLTLFYGLWDLLSKISFNFDKNSLVSEKDFHAFTSLKNSVDLSRTKTVNLFSPEGFQLAIDKNKIKNIFQTPTDPFPSSKIKDIKAGVYVDLHDFATSDSGPLRPGWKYKVIRSD